MFGITYLGKHSYHDMGITMAPGRDISIPKKKKTLISVPFSNEEYDFSKIYGGQTYEPRQLIYPFNIQAPTKVGMNNRKTKIINWLLNSHGKQKLYDDAYPGYYFLAELEGDASFSENWRDGTLDVTFKAYPFMISELQEGNDLWDPFNFELDVAQVTEFNINGTEEVVLYNPGTPSVQPKIISSSTFEIVKEGTTFTIPSGESESHDFTLKSGENNLTINGNGTIKFIFYKELI